MLPFQAALFLAAWSALRNGRWMAWVLTGVCAGLALLVKYVALFPLASLVLFMALDKRQHTRRQFAGALLAAAVALSICAPHIAWLFTHDFLPFRYARAVATHAPDTAAWLRNILAFTGWQLVEIAPLLLVLAWCRPRPVARREPRTAGDRLFLWTVGVGPFALLLIYAVLTRTELEPRWGSTMLLGAGWLLLEHLQPAEATINRLLRASAVALAACWFAVSLLLPVGARALHWPGRSQFPGKAFARLAMDIWRHAASEPLRIVVGDVWLGATLIGVEERPLAVLGDADPVQGPWVRPLDLQACGALVLQDRSVPPQQRVEAVTRLIEGAAVHGEWVLPWAPRHGLRIAHPEETRIGWAVLPPQAGSRCRL
jgi:hypothetical protein